MSGRIPTRIQSQGIGTYNPASPGRVGAALPAVRVTGPAQALEHFADRALNQIQSNAARATAAAKANPFGDGNLIQNISWGNGASQAISHGLGAPYAGFFLVNCTGLVAGTATATWIPDTPVSLNAVRIVLLPQGTFTSDVWVYR